MGTRFLVVVGLLVAVAALSGGIVYVLQDRDQPLPPAELIDAKELRERKAAEQEERDRSTQKEKEEWAAKQEQAARAEKEAARAQALAKAKQEAALAKANQEEEERREWQQERDQKLRDDTTRAVLALERAREEQEQLRQRDRAQQIARLSPGQLRLAKDLLKMMKAHGLQQLDEYDIALVRIIDPEFVGRLEEQRGKMRLKKLDLPK